MDDDPVPGALVDRLRANLRASGIPATEEDIQGVVERGFLRTVSAFERLCAGLPVDTGELHANILPDYLAPRTAPALLNAERPDAERAAGDAATMPTLKRPAPPGLPWAGEPAAATRHATLLEMATQLRDSAISPVELTEATLASVAAVDPALNAFQTLLYEEAIAAARTAEAEIKAGAYRGPLHGIPVAVKDLLAMRGTVTSAGSALLGAWRTDHDAAAVEQLRTAGAVIVGKTRLSEWAYSPGSNNAHFGPTANPWDQARDTGGSSSGSGAAVAAGLVYGALGTDTGGSIRIPAALCGVVGLKPSYGRCSLHGCATLAWSLDHLGPLTRGVADAAVMLQALSGADPRDPRTLLPSGQERWIAPTPEWLASRGVARLRIGVVSDDGSGKPLSTAEALAAWQAGLTALQHAGASLVELPMPELADLRVLNSTILVLEAAAFHQRALRERFLEFGPFPRQRLLHAYAHGPAAFALAGQLRARLRHRCLALFERVDLISTPSMPAAAPPLGTPATVAFTAPFNVLGWPAISVPVGATQTGLPLGLQLAGRPFDETTVLRAASAVEAYGPWRVAEASHALEGAP